MRLKLIVLASILLIIGITSGFAQKKRPPRPSATPSSVKQKLPLAGGNLKGFESKITGTYRLNTSLTDDISAIIDRALGTAGTKDRENMRISLERRLRTPEMLAIDMNNRSVTMGSSLLPKMTFQADGKTRVETNERQRTWSTTATVDSNGLTVEYLGQRVFYMGAEATDQRSKDSYLTIVPIEKQRIRVTWRIFPDDKSEAITVKSVYDKTSPLALFKTINMPSDGISSGTASVDSSIEIPVGTRLEAQFQSEVSNMIATEYFRMLITSPGQFRGAVIRCHILLDDTPTKAGRRRALFAFESVRFPDESTYRFNADILTVTAANGDPLEIANHVGPQKTTDAATDSEADGSIVSQRGDRFFLAAGSQITLTVVQPRPK